MADDLDSGAVERAVEVIGRTPGAQWYSAQQAARALAAAGLLVTPEHDAQVAARALDEAATALSATSSKTYAKAWLRRRADRAARQEEDR